MKNLPKFYAFYKDVNSGKLVQFDVLRPIWNDILTKKGKIRRSFQIWEDRSEEQPIGAFVFVSNKELLKKWLDDEFIYYYWSKCELEVIVCPWPYKDGELIEDHGIKIDVYYQLKPNLDLITDLVFDVIKDKL